jgi:folate-dependent tRNA-U54 methylase TrmFO/GidA
MRFFDMAPRDDAMKVAGLHNVFCAGEKAGPLVGHTEAVVTGALAGHNAVRQAMGSALLTLPRSLAVGEAVAYVREKTQTEKGQSMRFTFSGSVLFERIKEMGLYTTDVAAIQKRVAAAGLNGILSRWE